MILTVCRHGEAGDASSDFERELTTRGEDDIGFGCYQFHRMCSDRSLPEVDVILHSPWIRTSLTAEIAAGSYPQARLESAQELQPGSSVQVAETLLEKIAAGPAPPRHALFVSHQPLVSRLIDHLIGERGTVPGLPPGGFASLSLTAPAAGCASALFWAFPPDYEAQQ